MAGYTNRWLKVRCRGVGIGNMTEMQSAILVSDCNDVVSSGDSRSHSCLVGELGSQAVVCLFHCYDHLLVPQLVWQLCVLRASSSSLKRPLILASWARWLRQHQGPDCQWQLDGQPGLGGSWSELVGCAAEQYLLGCLPCQRFQCRGLVGWEERCQQL